MSRQPPDEDVAPGPASAGPPPAQPPPCRPHRGPRGRCHLGRRGLRCHVRGRGPRGRRQVQGREHRGESDSEQDQNDQ